MRKILLFIGIVFTTYSCGPSAEEIREREQFVADSTQVATEKAKQDSIRLEEQRIHQERIEVGKSIKRTKLSNHLKDVENRLSQQKEKLSRIKEFQIGRSSSTKERQLLEQRRIIRQFEEFKKGLEYEISHTHLHQFHDFQDSPNGTIEHLIKAADIGDYSKLRDIIDPYGEFNESAFAIGLVEMYPSEMKEAWGNEFANGRIMGTPKINGETAELEIAVGAGSNRLETIKLVKRQGKWYIQSL